jgi:hypothetical protein
MASNKRPPLELDELTNNLKQSSGQGIGAFFPSQPPPQEEKQQIIQEEQDKEDKQNGTLSPVPEEVLSTQYPSVTPKKREIKRRQPFDVYQDQVDLLKKISLQDQLNGDPGSMSRMVREALDNYLKDKKI